MIKNFKFSSFSFGYMIKRIDGESFLPLSFSNYISKGKEFNSELDRAMIKSYLFKITNYLEFYQK